MKNKKILFACVPADGHFYPLTPLAVYLQKQGYDVAWYTQDLYKEKIERLGIRYFPFERPPQLNQLNFETFFTERTKLKGKISKMRFDLEHIFVKRVTEYFEDIYELHKTFPFDMVVADILFAALPLIKKKLNVPAIAIGVIPVSEASKELPPSGLGMMPSYSFAGRIKQWLLQLVTDRMVFHRANKLFRSVLMANGVCPPEGNFFDMLYRSASLVLQNGTPGFEYPRSDLGKNIRFVGPLMSQRSKQHLSFNLRPEYGQFAKKILVTQGTVEKNLNKILIPALEAFRNTDVLVIITTGGTGTAQLKEQYGDKNFIIEDFIPFDEVMAYCDVFITNGGYGGVLQGIRHGLPMIVAGVHEGKNEINARVGYFKLGINLHTETPTSLQIKNAVENILNSNIYAENVRKLASEFDHYDSLPLCKQYIDGFLINETRAVAI
jgi:MGT family glycosyltransferase